jgi:hypothetical protein
VQNRKRCPPAGWYQTAGKRSTPMLSGYAVHLGAPATTVRRRRGQGAVPGFGPGRHLICNGGLVTGKVSASGVEDHAGLHRVIFPLLPVSRVAVQPPWLIASPH